VSLLLLSAFDGLSNFLSTSYQLVYQCQLYQLFVNVYQLFINCLSTVCQLFINFLSTFYQLFINFLSTVYQLFINFLSTVYQLSVHDIVGMSMTFRLSFGSAAAHVIHFVNHMCRGGSCWARVSAYSFLVSWCLLPRTSGQDAPGQLVLQQ